MKKLSCWLFALILIYQQSLSGQTTPSSPYTITDIQKIYKLSTTGFRDIFIDHLGRKWMASMNGGVFLFDGRKMQQFPYQSGLASNFAFRINEDSEGNIWVATNNGLSCFDANGGIVNHLKGEGGKNNFFTCFIESASHRKYAMGFAGLFLLKDTSWQKIDSTNKFLHAIEGKKDTTWLMKEDALYYTCSANTQPVFYTNTVTKKNFKLYVDMRNRLWVVGLDGIGYYEGKYYVKVDDTRGYLSMTEFDGKYFFGTNGSGCFSWQLGDTAFTPTLPLIDKPVLAMLPCENGLWIAGGEISFVSKALNSPIGKVKPVGFARYVSRDQYVYVNENRAIHYMDQGKSTRLFMLANDGVDMLISAHLDKDQLFVSTQSKLFQYAVKNKVLQEIKTPSPKATYDYVKLNDTLFVARNDGFFKVAGDTLQEIEFPATYKELGSVNALAVTANKVLVFKAGVGLFDYSKGAFTNLGLPASLLYRSISSMTVITDSITHVRHLLILDNASLISATISAAGQLFDWKVVDNVIADITKAPGHFIANTNGLWLNTAGDLHQVNPAAILSLPASLIYKIAAGQDSSNIWSGWRGDASFPFILKPQERNLTFQWAVPTVNEAGNYLLKWAIVDGPAKASGSSVDGSFNQSFSIPGNYKITYSLFDVLNNKVVKEVTLMVTVQPYWYETIWFKILMVILLVILIAVVTAKIVRRKTNLKLEKINREMEFVELRSRALQNIIAPHLLFNLFNNIQSKIMLDRKEVAIDVLGTLSEFIRSSLVFSRHDLVSLAEELEMVNQYIHLEASRNNLRPFDFEIKNNDAIDTEAIMFPSLVLQPLVENAIKYGGEYNTIGIEIDQSEGNLKVSVVNTSSDLAGKTVGTGHGLGLVKDKLALINYKYQKAGHFQSAPDGAGYRATIFLKL